MQCADDMEIAPIFWAAHICFSEMHTCAFMGCTHVQPNAREQGCKDAFNTEAALPHRLACGLNNPNLTFNGMNKTQISDNKGKYIHILIYAHATYIKMPI